MTKISQSFRSDLFCVATVPVPKKNGLCAWSAALGTPAMACGWVQDMFSRRGIVKNDLLCNLFRSEDCLFSSCFLQNQILICKVLCGSSIDYMVFKMFDRLTPKNCMVQDPGRWLILAVNAVSK